MYLSPGVLTSISTQHVVVGVHLTPSKIVFCSFAEAAIWYSAFTVEHGSSAQTRLDALV